MSRIPIEIWFKENPKTNDTKFEEDLLKLVMPSTLLLLDNGVKLQIWGTWLFYAYFNSEYYCQLQN